MSQEILIEVMFPKPKKGRPNLAKQVGEGLRERDLIACYNIITEVKSGYPWEGREYFQPEVMLLLKTVPENFEAVRGYVLGKHPYKVPCVISVSKIEQGHKPYLQWLVDNSQPCLQDVLMVPGTKPAQSLGNGS